MIVVADTGAVYALIDASDAWHMRVLAWWRRAGRATTVVLPVTILPEVANLLGSQVGAAAEIAFVRAIADGEFTTESLDDEDLPRASDLMNAYRDLPLGFVDASVLAIAERLACRDILTTDRRHFGVVRPRHVRTLVLHP